MNISDATDSTNDGPTRLGIFSPEGFGKALDINTPVLTPNGFVRIGDIKIGDAVIGVAGQPITVLGVYPQGTKKGLRVTTTDGGSLVCCAEHLWTTTTPDDATPRVRTTMEIVETLTRKVSGGHAPDDGLYPRHRLPLVRPVVFHRGTEPPIDPYVLGCLLGDGGLTQGNPTLHKPERDVLERVRERLRANDVGVLYDDGNGAASAMRINGGHTKAVLVELGLHGRSSLDKFIPTEFLFGSVTARLELLRGLVDTDGHVSHGTAIEYGTSSERLRDDVVFLARSLGAIVSSTTRTPHYTYKGKRLDGAVAHRISIRFADDTVPAHSAKHLAKWTGPKSPRYRSIESVEPVEESEFVCIKVDADDGLFVAADFIVTHNTYLLAHFPKVLIAGNESGIPRDLPFSVKTIGTRSWDDLLDVTTSLLNDRHDFETFAVDTIDWIEPLLHRFVCKRDTGRKTELNPKSNELISIEDYGFGRGFLAAEEVFRNWIADLDYLQHKRGMHIVLAMHAHVKKFSNPSGPDYDRYEPKPQARIAAVVKEWVENLLFGFYEVDVAKQKEDLERAGKTSTDRVRAKASGGGVRLLGTQTTALYDAKNRLGLPPIVELGKVQDLMPYLLGEHVGRGPAPRDVPASEPDLEPVTTKASRRSAPKDEPKPAHHEDRKDDEKRRQDDAYENARKNTADAERIAAEKRDAREWTEPKKPEPARDERRETQHDASPSNKKAPRDEQAARIEKLAEVVERAGKEKDAKYKAKVEKWIAGAKGDPDKIDAIIEDVENTLKAA